jgi:hypothetical protein
MPSLFGNRVAQFEAISPKGMSNLYELCFASVQVSVVIFLLGVGFIWPLRKSGEFIVGRLAEREGPESCFATVVQMNFASGEPNKIGKDFVFSWKGLGWETGFEPATFGATDRRSTS